MLLVSFFNGPKSHYLYDFTLKLLYICNSSWTRNYWCHNLLLNSLMRVGYGEYSLLILMPSSFVWVLHQPETERQNTIDCATEWIRYSDTQHPGPAAAQSALSSPCSSLLCVTQSTVVHTRVWLLDWGFLQVEGFWFSVVCGFKLSADSLFLDLRGFQEELWTFSWTLNIPKNSGVPGGWQSASDGHSSLFWKSRLAT